MNTTSAIRSLLLPVALVGALGAFAGCGDGGIDQSKIDDVKKQSEVIQKDAAEITDKASQIADDVKSGKITAEEAAKQSEALQKDAEGVADKAKQAGSDTIDAVKENDYLSDADKKQLEDAQKQLNTTTP